MIAVYAKIVIQFLKSFVSKPKINGFLKFSKTLLHFEWEKKSNELIFKPLHCVLNCAFWEQKRFWTKAESEPGTTRASSGGCYDHWATELLKIYTSILAIYSTPNSAYFWLQFMTHWTNLNRFQCKKCLLQTSMKVWEVVSGQILPNIG